MNSDDIYLSIIVITLGLFVIKVLAIEEEVDDLRKIVNGKP